MPLTVSIVTPERNVLSDEAEELRAPSVQGEVGILPGHRPMLAVLKAGPLELGQGEVVEHFALSGGFLEVSGDRVVVLAETIERAKDIDVTHARQEASEAWELLSTTAPGSSEHRIQQARYERNTVRVDVGERFGS